jgi:hypothetical protein
VIALDDSASEISADDMDSEALSAPSEDSHAMLAENTTPRADLYPSATAIRKAKATARAADKGLAVDTPDSSSATQERIASSTDSNEGGVPVSPGHDGVSGMGAGYGGHV